MILIAVLSFVSFAQNASTHGEKEKEENKKPPMASSKRFKKVVEYDEGVWYIPFIFFVLSYLTAIFVCILFALDKTTKDFAAVPLLLAVIALVCSLLIYIFNKKVSWVEV